MLLEVTQEFKEDQVITMNPAVKVQTQEAEAEVIQLRFRTISMNTAQVVGVFQTKVSI